LSKTRTLLLVDTPNIFRSAQGRYGLGTNVNYGAFRDALEVTGSTRCEAIVNGGVSPRFVEHLKHLQYDVIYSHAEDVDEMLIARAVILQRFVENVVIASGDGKNIELIRLLKAAGKRTFIAGIDGAIHRGLTAVADAVIGFPVWPRSGSVPCQAA
jgi:hypothetical protein